jgi:hypothetical protein
MFVKHDFKTLSSREYLSTLLNLTSLHLRKSEQISAALSEALIRTFIKVKEKGQNQVGILVFRPFCN